MPYRVEPACPGEGCTYGEWLACDTIELFASPGDTMPFSAPLLPSQRFEVTTGAVVVEAPAVVVVTRPTRQLPSLADSRTFAPGDTLFVLDYIGEGFFHAWHVDSILEVEVFWPWENFYPGDAFEYGGEVVQEGTSYFWVRTTTDARAEAWLRVNDARLAVPSSLDPSPLTCS